MLSIINSEIARQTILRRVPLGDEDAPASVLDRIEMIFGERITPQAAVSRILRDIRTQGDKALHAWTEKLDGKKPRHFPRPSQFAPRYACPLNVFDFIKIISLIGVDESTGRELSKSAAVIARAEGLEDHARSADQRL